MLLTLLLFACDIVYFLDSVIVIVICNMCLQYFDAVGWAAGRASGL